MWNEQIIMMLLEGIKDTLYMTLTSTLIGYVIGLPMGILLTVTDKDGIHPNTAVYKVLDVIANLIRSVPFLILLIVLMAYRFDMLIHVNYIRDAVIIGFISNEAISIVENAGLMGIPMPPQITKAIEILTKKSEEEHGNEEN